MGKFKYFFVGFVFFVVVAPTAYAGDTGWLLIDNFEGDTPLAGWTSRDTQNETEPLVKNPQVTEVRQEEGGNHYLIKKPAADGIVGNRKALTYKALPKAVDVGEIYTFYARFQVEYFPNNHAFGISDQNGEGIEAKAYDALEPSLRITDKRESNGYKNRGALMVKLGKGYKDVINFAEGKVSKPLNAGEWYEVWFVVNNRPVSERGQVYDVYLKGGEFKQQTPVYLNADFRMKREQPLIQWMMNCNTGPKRAPYGNGGVLYDDLYMSKGKNLSRPI